MKRLLAQVADGIIAGEPLWLVVALPLLIFPRGYVWQWQQGLFHYAPIAEPDLRYPGLLSWIGLGVVAAPWLLRWLRRGRPTRPTALDLPVALYLATAALSLGPSPDRAHSLNFLLVLIAGVAVYYGVVNAVHGEAQLRWAVTFFLAGGMALSAVGLLQTDWAEVAKTSSLPEVYRWLQSLPHPLGRTLNRGITAGVAVLFIPVGLALIFSAWRWWQRALAAGVTLVPFAFLLLSRSRGDLLALALTVPALGLWRLRRGPVGLVSGLLGLNALIAGLALYAPDVMADVALLYPSRWQVWERAAYIVRDHPFTGIGLDTFRLVAPNGYPYFDSALDQTVNAHNRLLQVGVDQGIVGLAAFVALILLFYRANRRTWQRAGDGYGRDLALGLCGGFTALMLGSTLDDGVLTGRAGPAVWYLLGLGMAQARLGMGGAAPAPAPSGRRWPGRGPAGALIGAGGLLLVALAALVLSPVVWHNLGNVARNRGWLEVDAAAGVREVQAARALAFYARAGSWAARDRGALIFLAHDSRRLVAASEFFAAVAAQTSREEAVTDLESAVARHPGDRFAHLYLAEAYRAAGRLSEAAAEYARAGAPVDWVVAEGRRRWDWGRGDYEGAVAQLTVATQMEPEAAEAYYALGLVYERQKEGGRAVEAYLRAADLYRDQGMVARAVESYERLLRLDPDNAYAQAELARLQGSRP